MEKQTRRVTIWKKCFYCHSSSWTTPWMLRYWLPIYYCPICVGFWGSALLLRAQRVVHQLVGFNDPRQMGQWDVTSHVFADCRIAYTQVITLLAQRKRCK